MTITAYGTGAYRAARPNEFVSTRAQFDDLQRQLSTKERATSYGDLGIDRRVSLDLNGKIAQIDSWLSGIALADVNLKLAAQGVETFSKLVGETRGNTLASNGYQESASGRSPSQLLAEESFRRTLDVLNTSVNGRYLFSGRTPDVKPVASFDEIMNGDGAGKAGLKDLIKERKEADLGATGLGRLTTDVTGSTVSVVDQAHDYGFKLAGATSSTTAFAITYNAGAPADIAVDVTAQPQPGDTLRFKLTLPDGTQQEIALTARAAGSGASDADGFSIGATPADTATALKDALDMALGREAKTSLSAVSAQLAAADFFAGSPNNPPKRVPGPDFANATTPPDNAGSAATTVIWYRGDDGSDPARSTATVQIGSGQIVGTGARANEEAFRTGLAQFAIMAATTFPAGDADSQAAYKALASRVSGELGFAGTGQKPMEIITEFGSAQAAIAAAKERHQDTRSYLATTLSGVENVTTEEVATQILSLQTQLQASYQVTSMLSKLSLTNFL
jgi:flagellin-like hook-associated protein FlgL